MSQTVVHGNTVYTAGQVALEAPGASAADQTRDILGRIDSLLAEAGTDKSKLISATIWLSDMSTFAEMNEVWDAWVTPGATPRGPALKQNSRRRNLPLKLRSLRLSIELIGFHARRHPRRWSCWNHQRLGIAA